MTALPLGASKPRASASLQLRPPLHAGSSRPTGRDSSLAQGSVERSQFRAVLCQLYNLDLYYCLGAGPGSHVVKNATKMLADTCQLSITFSL